MPDDQHISVPIAIQLQTMNDQRGGYFTGLKFAQGMMESTVALTEEAMEILITNLPEALADLRRQRLGLVVPQQAAAPKLIVQGDN